MDNHDGNLHAQLKPPSRVRETPLSSIVSSEVDFSAPRWMEIHAAPRAGI
jgi:hypothetical protein